MDAAKKSQTSDLLKNFTALKGIAPERFAEVLEKINIHDVSAGRYLFKRGDRDGVTVFLIKGVVELLDHEDAEIASIKGGSKEAADALAPGQPRTCSARVKKTATVATIGTNLLEVLTSNDALSGFQVSAIDDQNDDDWMTLMLRSPVFQKLPPVNISRLITGMEPVSRRAGDTVFSEGDEGDCYYTIKSGRCKVSRRDGGGKETVLAELGTGDGFGEDALLSDARRGATITMLTDGVLMKLAKSAFLQLLNQPLSTDTTYDEAVTLVAGGAKWLDVRTADEYQAGNIAGSLHLPFALLRDNVKSLAAGTSYIVCCNDGHLSNAAAFFLNQKGFDARVLTGGLNAAPWQKSARASTVTPLSQQVAAKKTAEDGAAGDGVPKQTYLKAVEARLNAEKELLKIKGAMTRIQQALHDETQARTTAEAELSRLSAEVDALTRAKNDAREHTAATAARIEQQARETATQLAAELDAVRHELEQQRAAVADVEKDRAALRQRIDALTQQLSVNDGVSNAADTRHRHEIEALNDTLRAASEQLEAAVREKNDAAAAARRADAELADLKRQLDATAKGGEAMTAQIQQAEQAKRTAVEQSEKQRAELDALREQQRRDDALHAEQIAALQREAAAVRESLAAMTGNAESARGRIAELERELAAARDAAQRATSDAGAVNTQLDQTKRKLDDAENAAAALRDEAATLAHKLGLAEGGAADAARERDSLRQELEALRAQVASTAADQHTAAQEQDQRRRALEETLQQSQAELEQAGRQRDALRAEVEQHERELSALRDQVAHAAAAHAAERAQSDTQRDEAQRLAERHATRVADLEQQLSDGSAAQAALNDEITQLRKQLEQAQASTAAAARTTDESAREITALRDELQRAVGERDALTQQVTRAESDIGALKEQLGAAQTRADDTDESARRLQHELDDLAARLTDTEQTSHERIKQLEHALASSEAAREQAGRELAARIAEAEAEIARERDQLASRESDAGAIIAKVEREAEYKLDKLTREIEELKKNLQLQTERANSLATRDKDTTKALAKYEKELAREQKQREKLEAAVKKAKEIPDGTARVAAVGGGLFARFATALVLIAGSAAGTWFYLTQTGPGAVPTPPVIASPSDDAATTPEAPVAKTAQPDTPAAAAPLRSFRDPLSGGNRGPTMIELPGGTFTMGASNVSQYFDERPQHAVSVPRFAISKYEVTFEDYDRFATATGRRQPGDGGKGRGNRPVTNVSWHDAVAYADWLSQQTGHRYRLPTEAEWEYAARAGSTTFFWWERNEKPVPANCFDCGGAWDRDGAFTVGRYKANAFGLHDTASNVEEWVQDCYHENYDGAPADGGAWTTPGCRERVARGGSFMTTLNDLRSSKRSHYTPDTRENRVGFRLARER